MLFDETGLCFELVEGVTGAAKDVLDFVLDEFLHFRAGRAEVFPWIKFLRAFDEHLSNGGGHRKAQVGVNVDLRATNASGNFNVGFRHALGIGHLSAVFIDFGDEFLRNAGSAVQHERIIAKTGIHEHFFDGLEPVQIQMLFALELVSAVRIADGDGK